MKIKWYRSIRTKLIVSLALFTLFFLAAITAALFYVRNSTLPESANREIAVETSSILAAIEKIETIAEEMVVTLASVASKLPNDDTLREAMVTAVLSADREDFTHLVSGGIWFTRTDTKSGDKTLFFNEKKRGTFESVEEYRRKDRVDYSTMEFYRLGNEAENGETRWTKVYIDPVTRIRMITVVSPIFREGRRIGVASVDIRVGIHSRQHLQKLEDQEHSYAIMMDRNGTFVSKSPLIESICQSDTLHDARNPKIISLLALIEPTVKRLTSQTVDLHKKTGQPETLQHVFIVKNDPIIGEKSVVVLYHFLHTHWNLVIGIPEARVMEQNIRIFTTVIIVTIVLALLAMLIGYFLLGRLFVRPLHLVSEQLLEEIESDGSGYRLVRCDDKGEVGSLVSKFNARTEALEASRRREEEEMHKRIANEKMLLQQSKMAAMGEMMDAAAHQWKQPLNALSMYNELLKSDFDEGGVDRAYIENYHDSITMLIDHMLTTLDAFRSFFRPNKYNQRFSLLDVIESVLFLMKDELMKHSITVTIERKDPIEIVGSENEFKHLILNILGNAKDAFEEHDAQNRTITIRLIADDHGKRLEIEDNAGGIPDSVIEDIFKPNVTTKAEGKGTGIGLYMSTRIAEKHHAVLRVENRREGACFIIEFEERSEDMGMI